MRRRTLLWLGASLTLATRAAPIASQGQPITLALMPSSARERRQLEDWVDTFSGPERSRRVQLRTMSPDVYKAGLESRLRQADGWADVHYWFAGLRLSELAAAGLVAPLDDLWLDSRLDAAFGHALRDAVTWRGRPYAVPLNYYQWGFYYRKSTFARSGLSIPHSWGEFLEFGTKALSAGLAPTATGARDTWTLAAWFDYIDLRLNGLDFHRSLTAGRTSFMDERVRAVFDAWRQLIDMHWFLPEAATLHWREALPYFLRERAATMLMGNFFEQDVPESLREDIGFFPFPRMAPQLPQYEDAPVDVLMVAAHSLRARQSRDFLVWATSPSAQGALAESAGKLPAHRDSRLPEDPLVHAGAELLRGSAGLAQFFDRDSVHDMAECGLGVFADFFTGRIEVDQALKTLEAERLVIGRVA